MSMSRDEVYGENRDMGAPRDFAVELYEDVSDSDEKTNSDFECSDEADDRMPQSERRRRWAAGGRDRSRSPLKGEGSVDLTPVNIRNFGEDCVPLDADDEEPDVNDDATIIDDFYAPDAHTAYVCERGEEERHVDVSEPADRNVSMNVRGRMQGERRGRAGRRGRVGRGLGVHRPVGNPLLWQVGQSPTEVWMTDEDVPSDLQQLIRDKECRRDRIAHERRSLVRTAGDRDQDERGNGSEIVDEDDEFQDAAVGWGNTLLEGKDLKFEWFPMESFKGKEEPFIPEHTGSVECHQTPYDAFRSFWDDDILQYIVDETNRYATNITSSSFQSCWYPTNSHELMCLFAFWMMLGIIRMPTIKSCFSEDPILKTEIFRRIFTITRYTDLTRALHFVDSTISDSDASSERLHSLIPIITRLNARFQANYVLSKDIRIDESLILWKGRLNTKQCIWSKAAQFGIKSFELSESATGYLWSFIVCTGKQHSSDLVEFPGVPERIAVVCTLIKPLLHKGHRLFMDNSYNCPSLARFLKRHGTDCVGPLQLSRPDVPALLRYAPLKQEQFLARHSRDMSILSWQDKKRVTMISTCHGLDFRLSGTLTNLTWPLPFKPKVVLDYSKSMGGANMKDQMLEPYLLERKRCAKWNMKLFKRLLNYSVLNSRILLESSKKCRQDHLGFRLQLVDCILTHHLPYASSNIFNTVRTLYTRLSTARAIANMMPEGQSHWPVRVEQREADVRNNRHSRNRCKQCSKFQRLTWTHYKCEMCDVPLCVDPCFKDFHPT